MPEKYFDKNENVERVRGTDNADQEEIELAYKKLCEFEQNYCEVIYKTLDGNIAVTVKLKWTVFA